MQKGLLLVDYINETCHPNGAFGCYPMMAENQMFAKINHCVNYARQNNWLIVWVIVGFNSDYADANLKSPIFAKAKQFNKLQRGTWGTEIISVLDFQEPELIICKKAVSPFYGTNLDQVLRSHNVEELFISGVSTEVAIQSAVREAHDLGYQVKLLSDCCASSNKIQHEASLEMLTYMAQVVTSEQLA